MKLYLTSVRLNRVSGWVVVRWVVGRWPCLFEGKKKITGIYSVLAPSVLRPNLSYILCLVCFEKG